MADEQIPPRVESCKTCRFWQAVAMNPEYGTCRFNPPYSDGFPHVTEKSWCGKFVRQNPFVLDHKDHSKCGWFVARPGERRRWHCEHGHEEFCPATRING